jgi:hypothetical protein
VTLRARWRYRENVRRPLLAAAFALTSFVAAPAGAQPPPQDARDESSPSGAAVTQEHVHLESDLVPDARTIG